MPWNVFKHLFPEAPMEQLSRSKNNSVILIVHNKMSISQLGVYSITVRHKINTKCAILCSFRKSTCPSGDAGYGIVWITKCKMQHNKGAATSPGD